MAGFYYNDFSLVTSLSIPNTLLPWYYKLSATWGGHEGSLLLWMTIMATWCALVSYFSRGYRCQCVRGCSCDIGRRADDDASDVDLYLIAI
ncbi:hypothetical protein [Psychrobacter sp. KH172YL61]|uniref:hypothetical protein n=1 Tax=Psychrobacter sp. KH172YL61 TaxID=2517899 RepID=UPI001F081324|nr:hypothetical protein [Psychrobacter sp. KH172YL61]